MIKLLSCPSETGENIAELLEVAPGAVADVHHDTLVHLMEDGHPIEQMSPAGMPLGPHTRKRRVR